MNLSYAWAELSDAPQLIAVYNAAFYDDFVKYGECPAYGRSVERMEYSILHYPKRLILSEGKIIGAISCEERSVGEYYIGCLCVLPEYQGRGVGTAAMRHILDMLPYRRVSLITPSDSARNRYFYTEKLGFSVVGEHMDGSVRVCELALTAAE